MALQRVLITGAAGGIGRRLRRLLRGVYPALRLSDKVRPDDLAVDEDFIAADLGDLAAVEAAMAGVDGIVHLGGMSVESDWETILHANIIGTRNLFEAARRQGAARIVFASSNHAMGFYPRRRRVGTAALVRPDSRYGVSKAFGEALGALYADKHGLRVLCIRIGNVDDRPGSSIRRCITRSSTAPPTMSGAGGTTTPPSASAIARNFAPRITVTRPSPPSAGGRPTPLATSCKAGLSPRRSSRATSGACDAQRNTAIGWS